MVRVREQAYVDERGVVDVERWMSQLPKTVFSCEDDQNRCRSAIEELQRARKRPGRDLTDWAQDANCELAGLETAQILAELRVDNECLLAALLYRAVREERLELGVVRETWGAEVAGLVEGVLRMAAISDLRNPSGETVLGQAEKQRDNIRKMLVALVDDVRVALIKLAERTLSLIHI